MKKTWEVWNEVLDKPEERLSSVEKAVKRVNVFLIEFEMGGWLYNLSPHEHQTTWIALRETADCLTVVGARPVGAMLLEIAAIVEQPKTPAATWEAFKRNVDPTGRIAAIEERITQEIEGLYRKLDAFTLQHFECEASY